MPRQKQLSIALQRIDSKNKKPRLWQLTTNLCRSGLPGVQFPLSIIKHLLLLCIHVQIFEVHTVIVIRATFGLRCTSVVMVLNLFLNLLQICIL